MERMDSRRILGRGCLDRGLGPPSPPLRPVRRRRHRHPPDGPRGTRRRCHGGCPAGIRVPQPPAPRSHRGGNAHLSRRRRPARVPQPGRRSHPLPPQPRRRRTARCHSLRPLRHQRVGRQGRLHPPRRPRRPRPRRLGGLASDAGPRETLPPWPGALEEPPRAAGAAALPAIHPVRQEDFYPACWDEAVFNAIRTPAPAPSTASPSTPTTARFSTTRTSSSATATPTSSAKPARRAPGRNSRKWPSP
jgi:hypothetical protein